MTKGERAFLQFADLRHSIYLARAAGVPRPWTRDPVLQQYRFTNVYRELDRTTAWFREHVRDRLRSHPDVLLATVAFRWFNRIEVGEAMFSQLRLDTRQAAFDEYARTGSTDHLRHAILQVIPEGPYVTGAYIIKGADGMDKLSGVLWCLEQFAQREYPLPGRIVPRSWQDMTKAMLHPDFTTTMEEFWGWLVQFPYMGPFMAYEVACDLRYTAMLERAPDKCTWANPGPGARRGLNRIMELPVKARALNRDQQIAAMQQLLRLAWRKGWDGSDPDHPRWEMREVEHTLCEFDKYERARLGEGRPRQVYR